MGAIDLDQHWPLPPYNGGATRVSVALPDDAPARARYAEESLPVREETSADRLVSEPDEAADLPAKDAIASDEPRLTPYRNHAGPVLWSALGFVAGMLVWHLVGFWSFVTDVVDRRIETNAPLPAIASLPAKKLAGQLPQGKSGRETAGIDPLSCVSLTIDRALGETRKAACTEVSVLRDAGFAAKTDRGSATPRLQDPGQWSNSTAVDASNIETGTLRADDVDLAIKP